MGQLSRIVNPRATLPQVMAGRMKTGFKPKH